MGVKYPHNRLAERLLFIGDLDHKHIQIQAKVGAGFRERRPPLARAGFRGELCDPLLLGIVGLSHRGVQLVTAGGVVALKLIVDLRRGAQRLFQMVGPDQRRRAIHLVDFLNLLRDIHIGRLAVHLLMGQRLTENGIQFLLLQWLQRAGIQQRVRLLGHIRPEIIPLLRHLVFGEVESVGNFLDTHLIHSFSQFKTD